MNSLEYYCLKSFYSLFNWKNMKNEKRINEKNESTLFAAIETQILTFS
jgi:hypothetical protein